VSSPKTEGHEGHGGRWVPLFPELRPYFEAAFEEAPEGAVYVISSYRDPAKNLRTRMVKIIKRAGRTPWPKLFHNLRASPETELAAEYPIHVVCAWIGNSALITKKHYLQVTDDYFERAAGSGAKGGAEAVQKNGAATCRTPQHTFARTDPKGRRLRACARGCKSAQVVSG
jgi:hypothetical protein